MNRWTEDVLTKLEHTDEIALVTARENGQPGSTVTVWVVRVGDAVYVRSYAGENGGWFRRVKKRPQGWVTFGAQTRASELIARGVEQSSQIDAAYRQKYGRYGGSYVDTLVRPEIQATTLELVPRAE